MNAIITTVLPVFGLIVVGYGLAKTNVIDAVAGRGITLFVFNVAIPAFLFRTVASMDAQDGAPWALWVAFFGGLAMAWVLAAIAARFIDSLNYSGGAAASMATGFGRAPGHDPVHSRTTPVVLSNPAPGDGAEFGDILVC
jgi:predicted permease